MEMKASPGGGIYDDVLEGIRKHFHAHGVCLIVIGGERGNGFGIQGTEPAINAITIAMEGVLANLKAQAWKGSAKAEEADL